MARQTKEERAVELLQSIYTRLKAADQGPYLYDNVENGGYGLMMDIENCLFEFGIEVEEANKPVKSLWQD